MARTSANLPKKSPEDEEEKRGRLLGGLQSFHVRPSSILDNSMPHIVRSTEKDDGISRIPSKSVGSGIIMSLFCTMNQYYVFDVNLHIQQSLHAIK